MNIGRHVGYLFMVIFVCGCGGSAGNAPTEKVTGSVTYKGAPVVGAIVTFGADSDGARSATGVTDGSGNFTLTTFEKGDGAVAGTYTVAISKTTTVGRMTEEEEHAAIEAGAEVTEATTVDELPVKYKSGPSSGLTAVVKPGEENNFPFALTD